MGLDMCHRSGLWWGPSILVVALLLAGCSSKRPVKMSIEPSYSFMEHDQTHRPATLAPAITGQTNPPNLRLTIR